ncbi:MAG TPA: hypothetical protein VLT88_02040 [Desulfosarcina sp.]|nr:hypothetical protein [Desulfosarcina sp.]
MKSDAKQNMTACVKNCEQDFRECLRQGREEVFCRIQRVPCDSRCNERHAA